MTVDEIISALCTIRCIPKGKLPTLVTYLIGQWANNLAPAGCGTPSDVIQISGAGSGDVNGIYVRNPILPNTYNSMDDPQAKIVVTGGNATLFYGLAGFERYYSSAADFPCAWTLGPDGALNNPTGQWLASPPVAWAPANEPVTWQDSGGAHVGDLPTFLATANVPSVSSLVFGATGNLTSLTGLKYLPSLATVDCNTNALTSLDLTNCAALTTLNCSSNPGLTTLTLTGCTALTTLDCGYCGLTSLDAHTCTGMLSLICQFNALTSINVTGLTVMTLLECNNNALTSLDVTTCSSLITLLASNNAITGTFDATGCTSLIQLSLNSNSITALNLTGITTITNLDVGGNQLTSINLTALTQLAQFGCDVNLINTPIDFHFCTLLNQVDCSNNSIPSVNFTGCTSLIQIVCTNNSLTALDVSTCTALQSLIGTQNNLTGAGLNVTGCVNLDSCFVNDNLLLTTIDVSTCSAITQLTASGCGLTSANVLGCTNLVVIDLSSNSLSPAAVDTVLCDTDTNGALNGQLQIILNSVPTAAGLVCSANLDPGKGWTVTHD